MSAAEAQAPGDKNLRDHLDPSQVNCLNETEDHTLKSILSKDAAADAYLESDADEQLLLNIYFNQKVRLRSLAIRTKEEHASHAPKALKLFINRPSIGFEDVEDASDAETAQALDLSEDDVRTGKPIALRYVRFQNVNSLHIFVASNQGDEDTSRIDQVELFGSLNEGTKDLSGLAAQDEE